MLLFITKGWVDVLYKSKICHFKGGIICTFVQSLISLKH